MREPYFSVLLPVYNGSRTLARAIESVRAQTDCDWEIVAVDDGSTDSSFELLQQMSEMDHRIRVFRIPNSGGPARPRNRAVAEARGRALCLLDQDDWWLPEKLELQRALLDSRDVGLVYGDAWIETGGSPRRLYSATWARKDRGGLVADLIAANFIPALTAVVRAEVAASVGPLHEDLTGVDEYHWWLRIAMAGYDIGTVSQPVAVYTVGQENLSHNHDIYLQSMDRCFRDLCRRHPDWRRPLTAEREALRQHAFQYYAGRLADESIATRVGLSDALRMGRRIRSIADAKQGIASAIPSRWRP